MWSLRPLECMLRTIQQQGHNAWGLCEDRCPIATVTMFVTTLIASLAKNRKEVEGMSLIFQFFSGTP